MNELISKLDQVLQGLQQHHGPVALFALESAPEKTGTWELVVSAKWLPDELSSYRLIFDEVKRRLPQRLLQSISRIVIMTYAGALFSGFVENFGGSAGPATDATGRSVYIFTSDASVASHLRRTRIHPKKIKKLP